MWSNFAGNSCPDVFLPHSTQRALRAGGTKVHSLNNCITLSYGLTSLLLFPVSTNTKQSSYNSRMGSQGRCLSQGCYVQD